MMKLTIETTSHFWEWSGLRAVILAAVLFLALVRAIAWAVLLVAGLILGATS